VPALNHPGRGCSCDAHKRWRAKRRARYARRMQGQGLTVRPYGPRDERSPQQEEPGGSPKLRLPPWRLRKQIEIDIARGLPTSVIIGDTHCTYGDVAAVRSWLDKVAA
jgi:hypothetical protein